MNAFANVLEKHEIKKDALKHKPLTTLQVNLGDLCNQSCRHCHIGASPQGRQIMARNVLDDICGFLRKHGIRTLDITGGAPECNPDFEYLVAAAKPLVQEVIVRSNLTVLAEPDKAHLPAFYKTHAVHLIGSLPCYTRENVDQQRGAGVFGKSIRVLRRLNELGFASRPELPLDLVYNPLGAYLPGSQRALEQDYKQNLLKNYHVRFNRLLTIANVAIGKFRARLEAEQECEKYTAMLRDHFNSETLDHLMCRTYLSVGYDGRLYDCDFNQALGLALQDRQGQFMQLARLDPDSLTGKEIRTGEHCLACTAGSGSGCQGSLAS